MTICLKCRSSEYIVMTWQCQVRHTPPCLVKAEQLDACATGRSKAALQCSISTGCLSIVFQFSSSGWPELPLKKSHGTTSSSMNTIWMQSSLSTCSGSLTHRYSLKVANSSGTGRPLPKNTSMAGSCSTYGLSIPWLIFDIEASELMAETIIWSIS